MNESFSFDAFGKNFLFLFRVVPKKRSFQFGYTNRCADASYVVFLDYDDAEMPLQWVHDEIHLLQELSDCGTAYVWRTRKGYHVVFLEKYCLGELLRILDMTTVDREYVKVPLLYGKKLWVLRNSEKDGGAPEYLGCVRKKGRRERSRAHGEYMIRMLKVPRTDVYCLGGSWDSEKLITMGSYRVG